MGVFLEHDGRDYKVTGLPHARGGVSCRIDVSTPHGMVFPTLVGVFLSREELEATEGCLPHARGGVS